MLSLASWEKVVTLPSVSLFRIYFADTLQNSKIPFVILMIINDCQVKRFDESLQKTDDNLKKTVFMHNSQ